jgi:hypothetical protein
MESTGTIQPFLEKSLLRIASKSTKTIKNPVLLGGLV